MEKKEEKSKAKKLKEKLLSSPKNSGLTMSDEEIAKADKFCEGYKKVLKQRQDRARGCYRGCEKG